jgi:3-methyl-2-oxobutanoate hydroxymethyltransferase
MKKISVELLKVMKSKGDPIACTTAYDFSFASITESVGIEVLLVGDSLGMVIQGHLTTLPVTLDDMIYHCKCVSRACEKTLVIADLPFGTFQSSPQKAFESAVRLLGEGGAHVVKVEGGRIMRDTVSFLVDRGIPVCGHLGLMPQSVNMLDGFRAQGRTDEEADRLRQDAVALDKAGMSLLVLEAIPAILAEEVTQLVSLPTIGIGAGPGTDGQVLVLYDLLGIYPRRSPKFSKNFLQDAESIPEALKAYAFAVRRKEFPGPEHYF